MKKIKKKWFTLIELMIVISILWVMMTMAYAPYSYFQKKMELKVAAKQIAKTLSESRSMAIHWISSSSGNLSIWVYFDNTTWKNNELKIYWFPYSMGTWVILNDSLYLLKTIDIEQNIQIDMLNNDKDNTLFLFEAITGKWDYSYFDPVKNNLAVMNNKINIQFSYKGASTSALQKNIEYYTKTYISDY